MMEIPAMASVPLVALLKHFQGCCKPKPRCRVDATNRERRPSEKQRGHGNPENAVASLGLPWLNTRRHHGGNPHAIASLIVLVLVLALVLWVFRRKPN